MIQILLLALYIITIPQVGLEILSSYIFRVMDAKFVGFPIGADRMALLTNQMVDQNSFL